MARSAKRMHVCNDCGIAFDQVGKLRNHMITHTGERPHVCKECGKGFAQAGNLKIHMRVHTGEKPYTCDTCGKSFRQSSHLKLHEVSSKKKEITVIANPPPAVIEKKSIIHALVQFKDGSTTAHYAGVDMKLPIAFALMGEVNDLILPQIDLLEIGEIQFEPIEESRYPIWEIREHLLDNPHLGVVVNSANEEAIRLFEAGGCNFFDMSGGVLDTYRKFDNIRARDIDDIVEIDREVRDYFNRGVDI